MVEFYSSWGWGRKEVHAADDVPGWRVFDWRYFGGAAALIPLVVNIIMNERFYGLSYTGVFFYFPFYVVTAALMFIPVFSVYTVWRSHCLQRDTPAQNVDKFIKFNDGSFKANFGSDLSKTVPIETVYEAFFAQKIDFKDDLLTCLYQRHKFSNFKFTLGHYKWFWMNLVPETFVHSRKQDHEQVTDHYDRGNDFYNAFLGETMIYTSAFFKSHEETLEQAQRNKLDLVCRKLHMKEGMRHLDLGCGWGTLICHAAKYYGTQSTGVTLAKEQVKWGTDMAKRMGVEGKANPLVCDYRDTPRENKYHVISCLEMAEHVGMKLFQSFLRQVYDMLEDDGLFYLQIAGLRKSWKFEDLCWGMFMGKYIFPGADASMPINWVVNQLESAGFEVHSVENVGVHYSATIKRWYDNWKSNEATIRENYGERWYRLWLWFLAWSVLSPEEGMATCHQIVCNKNTGTFNRKKFIGEQATFKYAEREY